MGRTPELSTPLKNPSPHIASHLQAGLSEARIPKSSDRQVSLDASIDPQQILHVTGEAYDIGREPRTPEAANA
jgi:hypothetical protein